MGIDIGMQTIAVVSDHSVLLEELAPNANLPYKELRKIQRAMDRSRRVNNPEMFQPNGIITPIHQLSPEYVRNGKRLWKESKQYKVLRQQRRYLYAKLARTRRYQHNEMANRIRTMGDAFYIETMKFEALRKKAPSPPKESGQKCRKRFGASIANKAPATLVNILEMKVQQDRGKFFRINTQKARASQYDHTDKTFRKKSLSTRWTTLKSGEHVQRDLYSALLLQNTNKTLDGFVQENIEQRFHNFMQMHDICINNLRYIPTPSSTGIKQIV